MSPQRPGIGQTVPSQRDREGHIQHDLAWIVRRPSLPPRRQGLRYNRVQAGLMDGLDQQHAPGPGDQSTAAALGADPQVRPVASSP